MLTKYEVNKPFPGAVPSQQGAIMDLIADGLIVRIQMPDVTRAERQAFKKSFKRYAYLETDTPTPIGIWIFMFPAQFGEIDVNFNAKPVKPEYIRNYLTLENDQVKNAITFYLLDGNILRGIKLVGLQPAAVKLFHTTIQKQLSTSYTQADYGRYLDGVFQYTTIELYQMGQKFKK